ncbi:MAG TPA: hypothetical protein VEU74_12120 [Gemmatimonadales bacterium]|nr:hypothetical protein [Gemmatimonadales bacterium]
MPLPTKNLGPFLGGVVDTANPLIVEGAGRGSYPGLGGKPVVRRARNCVLDGLGRLIARGGTQVALTLLDDQGSPAAVTSVVALQQFADGALAVGHSTITSKFYLYWLKADLTDWYNSSKALQGTNQPKPVAVLWTGAATPSPVLIAEGLNIAYIAHNNPGLTFNTMQFDTTQSPAVLSAFQANLRGSGLENTYFVGVVSFQQHLWGWGFGSLAAGDSNRPELLRFSTPFFAPMSAPDNFAVGHRVRSARETVVAAVVSGSTLYVGTPFGLWPITGFGRNSWDKSRPVDESYGFAGLRAACAGPNGYLYYWSHRGPLRVQGYGPPEPLWPRVAKTELGIINEQLIVAVYDTNVDQVVWLYQDATSGRVSRICGYDVLREAIVGPDGDYGLGIGVAAFCEPIVTAPLPGPAGPPTTPSTTGVGNSVATANWVNGDTAPETVTQLEYQPQSGGAWTVAAQVSSGVTTYQFTGLAQNTAYQWRAKHIRNGIASAYLGPVAGTQFMTTNVLNPPTNCQLSIVVVAHNDFVATITWTNSGESGVSTEVWWGPSGGPFSKVGTAGVGASSFNYEFFAPGTYQAEVRHVKTGATPSSFSVSPPATASNP